MRRPLVFGVNQDQPLADVQKFVEQSGVDVIQLHGSSLVMRAPMPRRVVTCGAVFRR